MRKQRRRRRCLNCGDLFMPDCRNLKRQKYCTKALCCKESKRASQARWLAKNENQDYFKGSENVRRVQLWRRKNPGYSNASNTLSKPVEAPLSGSPDLQKSRNINDFAIDERSALQDSCTGKTPIYHEDSSHLALKKSTLQDPLTAQRYILTGLIAQLMGFTLQDDIAASLRHLQQLGCDILASTHPNDSDTLQGVHHVFEKTFVPTTGPPGS